ncbi:mavicyanin-like [Pistacia vera]|uniref:mavicyanin-like n=1 Tax=Pistacia vera TaxID=55513 RepID=UPI001263A2B4|nr:mavicyanin-like [Pistacia vera]
MHDVMEVTKENFQKCNKENPIAVYRTGSDKIELKRSGLHFFICSTHNHCEARQKVSFNVDFAPGQPRNPLAEDLKYEKDNEESHAPSESPNAPGPSGGLPPYSYAPTYSPSP